MAVFGLYHRYQQQNHKPMNLLFSSGELITNVLLWWLYYLCFFCLIINTKCDLTMVHGSYSETDDLINELDRPSKYTTVHCICARSFTQAASEKSRTIYSKTELQ